MSVSPYRTPARSPTPAPVGEPEVPPGVLVFVIAVVIGIFLFCREPRHEAYAGSRLGGLAHSSAHTAHGRH